MPYGAGQDSFLGLCLAFSPCQTEAIADHSGRQANAEGTSWHRLIFNRIAAARADPQRLRQRTGGLQYTQSVSGHRSAAELTCLLLWTIRVTAAGVEVVGIRVLPATRSLGRVRGIRLRAFYRHTRSPTRAAGICSASTSP
jgi:hypothetical protein